MKHSQRHSGPWNGLYVTQDITYDPGVWRYPDGSGEPPSSEIEYEVELDDADEWLAFLEEQVFAYSKDTPYRRACEAALPWARIGEAPRKLALDVIDTYTNGAELELD